MNINEINLYNFRNFLEKKITFDDGINILVGQNGVGKTTVIEGIYFLSNLKSPRTNRLNDLVKKENDFFTISGKITKENKSKEIKINFHNQKATIFWQKKETKKEEIINEINTIIFDPDNLNLIKGEPIERREYLDIQLAQLIDKYYYLKKEYEKLLKHRNWLLKQIKYEGKRDYVLLDILTEKIIDRGAYIYNLRNIYINSLNKEIDNIFFDVSGLANLNLQYNTTPKIENFEIETIKKTLREHFQKIRKEEIEKAVTLIGVHRDDISFCLKKEDLKKFGSQGQQRLSVIALKLAEIKVFKRIKNTQPILLLDDVFSELDVQKKNKLLKYIEDNIQTIITTTELSNIDEKLLTKANKINLDEK